MNCIACKGTGVTKEHRKPDKQCYDCKGTGEAVYMPAPQVVNGLQFCVVGRERYSSGIDMPYRNTRRNKSVCIVNGYELSMGFMKNTDNYPLYYYPLKDVLFTGTDAVTGAPVCRPLWRSITLKRKHELFASNVVERV
jgi:hypothetical protein